MKARSRRQKNPKKTKKNIQQLIKITIGSCKSSRMGELEGLGKRQFFEFLEGITFLASFFADFFSLSTEKDRSEGFGNKHGKSPGHTNEDEKNPVYMTKMKILRPVDDYS